MFLPVDTSVALEHHNAPRGGPAGFGFFHETMNFMNFTSAVARNEFCQTLPFCDEKGGARRLVPVG